MTMKPKWIIEAELLLGTKEISGKKANPEIVKIFADAGFPEVKDDETAWCAGFVGATLKRAGLKGSKSLAARSYQGFGTSLGKNPKQYCIGIKKRGTSSWQGHVGYVIKWDKDTVWMLGGNQNNTVSIAPFKRSEFLEFVWPTEMVHTEKEVIKQSRQLSFGARVRNFITFTGLATFLNWDNLFQVQTFIQNNAGLVLFGAASIGWAVLKYIEWMNLRAHKEGRYVTKRS